MPRFSVVILAAAWWFTGCASSPVDSESTREIVLQYLGGDVGTAGPFGKGGKKELDALTPADRQKVDDLIDRGAVIFLVYGGAGSNAAGAQRVIVVQGGKIVGDFHGATPAPAAP